MVLSCKIFLCCSILVLSLAEKVLGDDGVINIITTGSLADIRKLSKKQIKPLLPHFGKFDISDDRKEILCDIMLGNMPPEKLTLRTLGTFQNIGTGLRDEVLERMNFTDVHMLLALGSFHLPKRKYGVIANNLKRMYGNNILAQPGYAKKFTEVICGFTPEDLKSIGAPTFMEINFRTDGIFACDNLQIKVLLDMAKSNEGYGPPNLWNETVVDRIGVLIRSLSRAELRSIQPEAMHGVDPRVFMKMTDKISWLTPQQIRNLQDACIAVYRDVVGFSSKSTVLSSHLEFQSLVLSILYYLFYVIVRIS